MEREDRIDEEQVSLDCFVGCLREQRDLAVTWKKEPDDPPDSWVTISGEKFAVEVTSIVAQQSSFEAVKSITSEVERLATASGCLSGKYVLNFSRAPTLPGKNSSDRRRLVRQVCDAIRSIQSVPAPAIIVLRHDRDGKIELQKMEDSGSLLCWGYFPEPKFEEEANAEMHDLFQKALIEKRQKLERKGVDKKCPNAILLLFDAYGYGGPRNAMAVFKGIEGSDWFHSVFWVMPTWTPIGFAGDRSGRRGLFLSTRCRDWIAKLSDQSVGNASTRKMDDA